MYKGLRMTVLQSKNSRSSINYQWTNNRYFETRVMPNEDHRWINKRHFENHQGKSKYSRKYQWINKQNAGIKTIMRIADTEVKYQWINKRKTLPCGNEGYQENS